MSERTFKNQETMDAQVKRMEFEIANALRGTHGMERVTPATIALAYVLYLAASDEGRTDVPDLKAFLAEKALPAQLRAFIMDRIGKERDGCRKLLRQYDKDALASYLLCHNATGKMSGWQSTPDSISMLALRMLGAGNGSAIADVCCGTGNFLKTAAAHCLGASLTGMEISAEAACVAKMRSAVIGGDIDILQCDALDSGAKFRGKFDYVFCDPPYAMPLEHIHCLINTNGEMRTLFFPSTFPSLRGRATSEWVWLLKAIEMLKPDGKAAILVPLGRMFSTSQESQYRRYLVENGHVESVVALPGGLLDYSGIRLALVILSRGNSDIRLIDADGLCVKRRGGNTMTEAHVDRIVGAKPDDGICRLVSSSEIAANEFSLDPASYGRELPDVPNAVPLSEVVTSIGRGMAFGKDGEEDIPEDAPARLVTVSDISDGRIADELKPLPGSAEQYSRYVIEDGDVVIGKVPAPFKVAVAKAPEKAILVASVNLYILKVDRKKCDPHYLQAYLCSNLGQAQISGILKGNVLLTIPAEGLARIPFPMRPLEEQKAFADKFREKLQFVRVARMQADKAARDAETAFDAFLAKEAEL